MSNPLPDERKASGTMPHILTDYTTEGLSTSRTPEKEVWALLEYYLIDDSAHELFISKGVTDKRIRNKVVSDFQSYITQASNFYEYAKNSDPRSSALLYYYSFMNLAKAKLLTSNPSLHEKKFIHGMKRVVETGNLRRLTIRSERANRNDRVSTFQELYKARFNANLPSTEYLKIVDLLGYVSDIASEYTKVTNNSPRFSNVKFLTSIDKSRKKSWAKIAIQSPLRILKYKRESKDFFSEFTQVKIGTLSRQYSFELTPHASQWYQFYEGKTEHDFIGDDGIDIWSSFTLLKKIFRPFYQAEVYDSSNSFQLTEPLTIYSLSTNRVKGRTRIDELLAIYLVMYHLSEIVRYEPYFIDKLLSQDTKEGWMLRSFIESAPYTFLLRMTSWITEKHYFIQRR